MAAISIVDHELPYDSHNTYDVSLGSDCIHTLVTHSGDMVESWLAEITPTLPTNHHIVGLDVEWRPSFNRNIENPVATLQLCVGHRCLIYQLIHSEKIPQPLFDFLGNGGHKFMGVGIASDVEKLLVDYDLGVSNAVDLGALAEEKLGVRELRKAGLKGLAKEVLGKEVEKPKRVTMSRWDNPWLTWAQVQYACVDAFLSFEIGRTLNASSASASARA